MDAISGPTVVLDFCSVWEPWVSSSGPQRLVFTAPLTSRAAPCQAMSLLVRHGKEFTPDRLTTGLPTWAGWGPPPLLTMKEGPRGLEPLSLLICIFILKAFPPKRPLWGHPGKPSPTTDGRNLQFSTCFSSWASETSFADDLAAGRSHLCLHLNVFLKRPLIPLTK